MINAKIEQAVEILDELDIDVWMTFVRESLGLLFNGKPTGMLRALDAMPGGFAALDIAGDNAAGFFGMVHVLEGTSVRGATAAGGQLDDSACATFTINALGVKSATKQGGGASTTCWD